MYSKLNYDFLDSYKNVLLFTWVTLCFCARAILRKIKKIIRIFILFVIKNILNPLNISINQSI